MSLSRDQILAVMAPEAVRTMKVDIPEWGDCVYVRALKIHERDEWEEYLNKRAQPLAKGKKRAKGSRRARFIVLCTCDEAGKAMFTDADIPAIDVAEAAPFERIVEAGMTFNAMTKQEVEDMEGN